MQYSARDLFQKKEASLSAKFENKKYDVATTEDNVKAETYPLAFYFATIQKMTESHT